MPALALSLFFALAAALPLSGSAEPPKPACGAPLLDTRDGRSYPTVAIGTQCWMGRNLDYGRALTSADSAGGPGVDKRCYGDAPVSCRVYGGLYTWDEALQGERREGSHGACPAGWHVPSRREWEELARFLGPAAAGEALKATKDHDPAYDGTDAVGFTALPAGAGFRGSFGRKGHWAVFWTSTEESAERAASVGLDRFWYPEPPRYRSLVFDSFYLKENAFSLRCLADEGTFPVRSSGTSPGGSAEGSPRSQPARREAEAHVRRAERPGTPPPAPPRTRGDRRPNILCIVCEDISPLLGSYGDTVAISPVLDRLAREGVRFTRMFDVSGVCAPSRAALITGMYPTAIGADHMRTSHEGVPGVEPYEVVPPPAVRPYTELMRAHGYYTTNNAKTDYQFRSPLTAWDENGREAHWRHRPPGMPFFSIFNIETTHESQVWDRVHDPVVVPPERVLLPPYFPDTPIVRRDVARVYSNVAVMDREVGELLAELDEAGLSDETVVIFYSDNGGPLPRQKRQVLDSGLHVPFIMRFPGGEHAGEVVDDLVSFVDVPATILSLAGVGIPGYMQGRAFWGGQKAAPREYVFAARDRLDEKYDAQRAARDRRFLYVRNFRPERSAYLDVAYRRQMGIMQELLRLRDAGQLDPVAARWFRAPRAPEELYDTVADPYDVHDLARDPAWAGPLERLRRALDEWMRQTGDDPLRPETELVASMWPGGVQPATAAPAVSWRDGRVEIECPTEGAAVAYQVDGRGHGPDHWLLYTGPFAAAAGSVVTATANRVGYVPSPTVTFAVP
jgi:N-sulfoglucosamine sulfohydrolase